MRVGHASMMDGHRLGSYVLPHCAGSTVQLNVQPSADAHASIAEQLVSCGPVFPFCCPCTVPSSGAPSSFVANDCTCSAFRSSASFFMVQPPRSMQLWS